jgi:tRNA G18 (ribose-2'-O)-methylase SpoU
VHPVEDAQDPRLDMFRGLKQHLHRPHPEFFLAETERLVTRLCRSRFPVEAVLCTPPKLARLAPSLPAACPVYVAERDVHERVMGHDFHKGCLAVGRRLPPEELAWEQLQRRPRLTLVACDRQADPINLGAMIRNCRAFGVDWLLVDGRSADPFTPRALRASTGMTFFQPMTVCRDLPATVRALKERLGLTVLAAHLGEAAEPLPRVEPRARQLLLMGQEGAGVSEDLLPLADREVVIPIGNEADSLNVAASSAVLLYALGRPPHAR